MNTDLIYWVAVSHLLNVKLTKLHAWFNQHGSFANLFAASETELMVAGFHDGDLEHIKKINWATIEKELHWYQQRATVLPINDPRYPVLLKEISDPPLVLYVCGEFELLSAPQLGLVGTRHPSPFGLNMAQNFAQALVEAGLVVTSGLAMGIDGACHQSALAAQGKTIAVMGTGLNHIYPRYHERLAENIKQAGALITEFPLNTPPFAAHFPRRNRIISGLSLGVLVIEAALRSGSLITARYALEQNREVFAIPGSINHTLARGCHQLIRQGAKLVESVNDIIEELGSRLAAQRKRPYIKRGMQDAKGENLLPAQQNLLNLLNYIEYSVMAFDAIVLKSGLTAGEVSSILLSLELKGYVQATQGGYMRCT